MSTRAHRLFIAYDLPGTARTELARLGLAIATSSGGRAVPPDNLHATACFIGACDDERLAELAPVAFDAMGGSAIPTALGRVHLRPRPGAARLAAVELADPTGALVRHAAAIWDRIAPIARIEPPTRPLWPHVTVTRMSRPTRVRRFPTSQGEHVFAIDRVTLYDSYIASTGPPRYEALMTVPLGQLGERTFSNG